MVPPITALLNKKGVSLVEVMIALVILLLVSLALMQTTLISINANMNNALRDEAVSIAEQVIIEARNIDFNTLATTTLPTDPRYLKYFRNLSIQYAVTRTITVRDVDNKQIDVRVTWQWKGESYNHDMNSIRRRS